MVQNAGKYIKNNTNTIDQRVTLTFPNYLFLTSCKDDTIKRPINVPLVEWKPVRNNNKFQTETP